MRLTIHETIIWWCDIMRTKTEYSYELEGKGFIRVANSTNVPIVVEFHPEIKVLIFSHAELIQEYSSKEKLPYNFFLNSAKPDKLAVHGKVHFMVDKFTSKKRKKDK